MKFKEKETCFYIFDPHPLIRWYKPGITCNKTKRLNTLRNQYQAHEGFFKRELCFNNRDDARWFERTFLEYAASQGWKDNVAEEKCDTGKKVAFDFVDNMKELFWKDETFTRERVKTYTVLLPSVGEFLKYGSKIRDW